MKQFVVVALPVVCGLLAGCVGPASVPLASVSLDQSAKSFATEPDRGNLYVCRSGGYFGSAILCQVMIDDKAIGGLAPGTYHVASLSPGQHTATVFGAENQGSETILIEAGKCQFARIEAEFGQVSARWKIKPISEDEGRRMVSSGKRAAGITAVAPAPASSR